MSFHHPLRVRPRRHLFLDAADILRNAITEGEYPPGTVLPGEEELAARHGISRTVLRQALVQLASENLVRIRHGVGNVTQAPTHDTVTRNAIDAFHGLTCTDRHTDSQTTADERIAALLGIEPNHRLHLREQLATHTPTGRPVLLRTVLPRHTATDLNLASKPFPERTRLLALLDKHFAPLTATDIVRIAIATTQEAAQLDLPEPATLIETTRLTHAAHGGALIADIQRTAAHGIDLVFPLA